jgi:predicted transcriptional regulator YdeE
MECKHLIDKTLRYIEAHLTDALPGICAIYNDWIPQSAYERLAADDFELYDERFKFGEPDSVMEIWVPIKKK